MTSILLVHRRTRSRLKYSKGSETVYVDDEHVTLNNKQQKEVIWLLLSNFSKNITHKQISDYLTSSGRGNKDEEPNKTSGKFIYELKMLLSDVDKLEHLIESVRGVGYRVNNNWVKTEDRIVRSKSIDFLSALDSVVEDCLDHVEKSSIITMKNGLQYINFDRSFAIQKYQILDKLLWDTIEILASQAKAADLIDIKTSFQDLASYVLYWRFGDSLSEEKWKLDYFDEINTKSRRIRSQIEDLLRET